MYIHTHTHIHTHRHIYIYTHTHTHTHTHTPVYKIFYIKFKICYRHFNRLYITASSQNMYLCCSTLTIICSPTSPKTSESHYYSYFSKNSWRKKCLSSHITHKTFHNSRASPSFTYVLLYITLQLFINVRRELVHTILLHCIRDFFSYLRFCIQPDYGYVDSRNM
jgi:hypothetical protein